MLQVKRLFLLVLHSVNKINVAKLSSKEIKIQKELKLLIFPFY